MHAEPWDTASKKEEEEEETERKNSHTQGNAFIPGKPLHVKSDMPYYHTGGTSS